MIAVVMVRIVMVTKAATEVETMEEVRLLAHLVALLVTVV